MNFKIKIGYIIILILYPIIFNSCVANQPKIEGVENSGVYKYDKSIREYEYGTFKN
jgi:hypothetical protein